MIRATGRVWFDTFGTNRMSYPEYRVEDSVGNRLLGFIDGSKRDDSFPTMVVAESLYQATLVKICGKPEEKYAKKFSARLVPENNNPHDKNAVMVRIELRLVGYLSREDALTYRGKFQAKPQDTRAKVTSDNGKFYRVWLKLDLRG